MPDYKLGQQVDGKTIIYGWNIVTESAVYTGGITNLHKVEPKWHTDDLEFKGDMQWLTLDEIAEQFKDKEHLITVFVNDPVEGHCFQYGNYGDYWVYYGRMFGYS